MLKKIVRFFSRLLGFILLLAIGFVAYLTMTEYHPQIRQPAEFAYADPAAPAAGNNLRLYTWNIGYGGLGEESDFFMDGGEMVNPPSAEVIQKNLAGIQDYMAKNPAQVWLLQEVDLDSSRSNSINQLELLGTQYGSSHAFAYNYKCAYVPYPLPPIGSVESGIATLTNCKMDEEAVRIALPCPFSWPVSVANLKRCLLVTRLDVAGSDKELVIINLHLEAYDDGEGKIAQTQQLVSVLQAEYAKGNYVIAGGDFNQTFPGGLEAYPIADSEKWTPGILEDSILPEGWQFAYDTAVPTCRLLDQPFSPDCQLYLIDGFILSPNVELNHVQTVDLDFQYSDHNPVQLDVTLKP